MWTPASRSSTSGAPPGTIHGRDAGALSQLGSTPSFGVADAIELARVLGRLPARLDVYAIEGADFGHGEGLTSSVIEAVGELVQSLRTAVRSPSGPPLR